MFLDISILQLKIVATVLFAIGFIVIIYMMFNSEKILKRRMERWYVKHEVVEIRHSATGGMVLGGIIAIFALIYLLIKIWNV